MTPGNFRGCRNRLSTECSGLRSMQGRCKLLRQQPPVSALLLAARRQQPTFKCCPVFPPPTCLHPVKPIWRPPPLLLSHSRARQRVVSCIAGTGAQNITLPAADQPRSWRSWLRLPAFHSEFDASIIGLAVPALASLFLDPLMSLVDTGNKFRCLWPG